MRPPNGHGSLVELLGRSREHAEKSPGPKKGKRVSRWWLIPAVAVLLIGFWLIVTDQYRSATLHFPSQGHQHIPPAVLAQMHFPYNSDPPTSGPHWELVPNHYVRRGSSPWPTALSVHMLEHGNVIIDYNPNKVSPRTVAAIITLAGKYDSGPILERVMAGPDMIGQAVLVQPYPSMEYAIALTAWTRLEPLKGLDLKKAEACIQHRLGNIENTSQ